MKENEKKLVDEIFNDIDDLEFVEISEATALPEIAATSGSALSQGCSCCGSSSCCSST